MIEFFFILGIAFILHKVFDNNKIEQDFKKLKPLGEPSKPATTSPKIPLNVVARSVYDIVGTYMDQSIYRYVQVDDGRTFIFESIAVERSPGVYHADDLKSIYIIVDKCLLYREFKLNVINI